MNEYVYLQTTAATTVQCTTNRTETENHTTDT